MFQSITHSFPSNYCRNKITKGKESDNCDLCKVLQVEEGRFTSDDNLLPQTLGNIQHSGEALSEIHTFVHHHCWWLPTQSGQNLGRSSQRSLTYTRRKPSRMPTDNRNWTDPWQRQKRTDTRPAPQGGKSRKKEYGTKSPDRLAIKIPTTEKLDEFVTLDFKRMSDVTDQYVTRSKHVAEAQYESIKSTLKRTLGPQGWLVRLRSVITLSVFALIRLENATRR